jgi:hypothetical protein
LSATEMIAANVSEREGALHGVAPDHLSSSATNLGNAMGQRGSAAARIFAKVRGHRRQRSAKPSHPRAAEPAAKYCSGAASFADSCNRLRGHAAAMSNGAITCSLLKVRGSMRRCCAGADRAARQVVEGSAGVRSPLPPTRTPVNTTKTRSSGREGSTILLRSHGSNPPVRRREHATRPPPAPVSTRQPGATTPSWRSWPMR